MTTGRNSGVAAIVLAACLGMLGIGLPALAGAAATCERTITADVVALDQPFWWNRLGAAQPHGMMYALKRDVEPMSGDGGLTPGSVKLRADKRPRPLVLRMNVGDCLQVIFTNLLMEFPIATTPTLQDILWSRFEGGTIAGQPWTRNASIAATGLSLVGSIESAGANVGENPGSLVGPGGFTTYTWHASHEGTYVLYSAGAMTGGEGNSGSTSAGLFGAISVEPRGAEWYRSQVTEQDLALATVGTAPTGHPVIDYDALYPADHRHAGLPILKMLHNNEIVHTDLTAIITGPGRGRFPAGTYRSNAIYPERDKPFREFTIIYHDEVGALQAFPEFFHNDETLGATIGSVSDAFAINYGIAGVGAEVIANRLNVGPAHRCPECLFEEFFLSSWAMGDPAMVVDVPANATGEYGELLPGPRATRALYPDDPSNVYHSYLGDHVKFRILHGGSKEHHIHHQHAKQWLFQPENDKSTYLDSQAIGPGAGFTLETSYHGSGNRNQTVGDAIFHCHFYPHFAGGMWALWRSHDVFEAGTALDAEGRPVPGARALPDGEIPVGTPIPALVPLPLYAMAPLPGAQVAILDGQAQISGEGNPGYPFFVPGLAGHRPPTPPLDTLVEDGIVHDGGLPRHIVTGGEAVWEMDRLSFGKHLAAIMALEIPEEGTPVEQAAMAFHATRRHPTALPDGTPATFIANGLPPAPGAPFADPCMDDAGSAKGVPRIYRAANLQIDMTLNKAGWHYPQSRMLALWGDVAALQAGTKPPEPFFFRANTNDCISYYQTNLIPNYFAQDAFQVKTPTDIIGQHIHLVKFDVTSSDGAANGWNYEDGVFSADEVLERIAAINATGGLVPFAGGDPMQLAPKAHPFFGVPGAQTKIQRWYADNVLNNAGQDRTLRTVYTHDHFGPSTHQQIGLYAGLVIEPQGSTWRDSESGAVLGSRFDGGPTSWRADIIAGSNGVNSFREFLLEFADFQLAYTKEGAPVNPPYRKELGLPYVVGVADECPGFWPTPCPEAISDADPGTMSVNYRNEPIALRVRDPYSNAQAAGLAGDLSHVFRSDVERADPDFNRQPDPYPPLTADVRPGDPFTPLLRAYENDRVQLRVLVGAQEEGHNFSMEGGPRWLFEAADPNSGYRNAQMMGISEHFEIVMPPLPITSATGSADMLYKAGSSVDDLWNGLWGLMRVYKGVRADLRPLPNNPNGKAPALANATAFNGICPRTAPLRQFDVTAVTAQDALPGGTLVYNERPDYVGMIHDPTAILYVRTNDLENGRLKFGVPVEPLILRAAAGDCIELTLRNNLPPVLPDLPGFNLVPPIVDLFNANQIAPSSHVGLHTQLLSYMTNHHGQNVGFNGVQTAAPGETVASRWYAGIVTTAASGYRTALPVEFGGVNLMSSDPIKHSSKGAIGALVIEPRGSTWVEDPGTRAAATVTKADGKSFRDFVLLFQNDLNLRFEDGSPIPIAALAESHRFPRLVKPGFEDAEDSGQRALNYRTEPMWKRLGFDPDAELELTETLDYTDALSNSLTGGDPLTPVFTARVGQEVRFRLLMPGGHQRNNVFTVQGHAFQWTPYVNGSTAIGYNPLSEWTGGLPGHGPSNHFDAVLTHGAGGAFGVPGDYLYRTFEAAEFDRGIWGILRVTP